MFLKFLRMKTIIVTSKEGKTEELSVTDSVAELLMSDETDASVKSLIVNTLKKKKEKTDSVEETVDPNSLLRTEEIPDFQTVPSTSSSVHCWTSNEEDLLVSLRHDKNGCFIKCKNHVPIWRDIATEINEVFKCLPPLSYQQVNNKYNSLKKRWKEVIDAGSGTETKFFRQREAFDQMYGTRASTKPIASIDSLSTDSNGKAAQKTPAKCRTSKKRQSNEIINLLDEQNQKFSKQVEEFHRDKMSRLDRLLDLYEKDIQSKPNS